MARKTLEERFWQKVDKQPGDGCWVWTAYRDRDGYGEFWMWEGHKAKAHRASWWLHYGEWPRPFPEYTIDHLCRNPSCVRPDHLEDVTNNENTARGENPSAAALRTGKCINGHDDWYTKPDGRRNCRACQRQRDRTYYARKKAEKESAA